MPANKKPDSISKVGQWDVECSTIVFLFFIPVIFYCITALVFLVNALRASYAHPVEEVVNGKKRVKPRTWTYVAIAVLLFVIAFSAWNIAYPPKGEKCKNVIKIVIFIVVLELITSNL